MAAASAGATQTGFLSGAIASSPSHLQQHHSGTYSNRQFFAIILTQKCFVEFVPNKYVSIAIV